MKTPTTPQLETSEELKKFVEEKFKWSEVYDGWSDGEYNVSGDFDKLEQFLATKRQ